MSSGKSLIDPKHLDHLKDLLSSALRYNNGQHATRIITLFTVLGMGLGSLGLASVIGTSTELSKENSPEAFLNDREEFDLTYAKFIRDNEDYLDFYAKFSDLLGTDWTWTGQGKSPIRKLDVRNSLNKIKAYSYQNPQGLFDRALVYDAFGNETQVDEFGKAQDADNIVRDLVDVSDFISFINNNAHLFKNNNGQTLEEYLSSANFLDSEKTDFSRPAVNTFCASLSYWSLLFFTRNYAYDVGQLGFSLEAMADSLEEYGYGDREYIDRLASAGGSLVEAADALNRITEYILLGQPPLIEDLETIAGLQGLFGGGGLGSPDGFPLAQDSLLTLVYLQDLGNDFATIRVAFEQSIETFSIIGVNGFQALFNELSSTVPAIISAATYSLGSAASADQSIAFVE